MYRLFVWPIACLLAAFLPISGTAHAAFQIFSDAVLVDAEAQQTTFTLTFNQQPDFFTLDEFGRPANSFQYFYDSRPGGFEFEGEDVVIIRGPEIHLNNTIPIRASLNPTGETLPNAEGWGPQLGTADFELDGLTLSFTTPWQVLGETDRRFSYRLIATEGGELTSDVSRVIIPLHPAVYSGLLLLIVSWLAQRFLRSSIGR